MGKLIEAAALLAIASAFFSSSSAARAQPAAEPAPLKPGALRLTTRVPELDKWTAQTDPKTGRRVFNCKPLACPASARVIIYTSPSPTRKPDPQALEKFAKVDLPKMIRANNAAREILTDGAEKTETLVSKTATLKGYSAVVNETKFSRGKTFVYIGHTIIFAGPAMINVQSLSPDRALAKKNASDFIEVMVIEEGPPLPPPSPPAPPGQGRAI